MWRKLILSNSYKNLIEFNAKRSLSNLANSRKRVFSGIQPTGDIHVGNYFGAIKKWVELQNDGNYDVTYCIVDLHSITVPQDPKVLRENSLKICATLLACGICPEKSTLFLQSEVKEHSELCWILSCITTMARLTHLPQYKDKSSKFKEVPLGLYLYPILQAADIMLHKTNFVPVGEDQIQHVQLAQHLTKNFNNRFGVTFPTCEPMIADDLSCRIKSLRDPSKKMSKSDIDKKSFINLTDTPNELKSKVKKSVTDCTSAVTFDIENRPGVSNLIMMHSLVSGKSAQEICDEVKHLDTGKYKSVVADALVSHFEPIRKQIEEYSNDKSYLHGILNKGNDKAREFAARTMKEVKEKVGLGIKN